MATILCLETATTNCSVALSVDGSVLAFKEDNPNNESTKGFSHAEKLHLYIDQVLQEAHSDKSKLDAVAVSKGPGSYTGLRIGVSAAKGLCFALDLPLISINTLRSLMMKVTSENEYVIPMLDARRMEVYSAIFSEGKEIRKTEAQILTEDSFIEYLEKGKCTFIGDGAEKFSEICTHTNAEFITNKLPSAIEMAKLSEEKFSKVDFESVAYFEPYYLKDFVAGGK